MVAITNHKVEKRDNDTTVNDIEVRGTFTKRGDNHVVGVSANISFIVYLNQMPSWQKMTLIFPPFNVFFTYFKLGFVDLLINILIGFIRASRIKAGTGP
jgi:hypothetical protein